MRADNLGHTIAALKRMIVGGRGIDVRPMGDQVEISAKAGLIPTGGGGGGAGNIVGRITVPTVEALPAVPTNGHTMQVVFWTSADAGTGDDGLWWTKDGMTRWYPMVYSTLSGAPGAEELSP